MLGHYSIRLLSYEVIRLYAIKLLSYHFVNAFWQFRNNAGSCWGNLGTSFQPMRNNVGTFLGHCSDCRGTVSGKFRDHVLVNVGTTLGQCWVHVGIIVGSCFDLFLKMST